MAATNDGAKYEVLEKIGHGSFGIIHKVRRKTDNEILCRKEISYIKMSQKEREQLHSEFSILSSLRHPNIVAYYHRDHLKSTQDLHLYMEYCGGGDLSKVILSLKAKNQYAEEAYVWSIFSQLVTALYRCHYGVDPPEVGQNFMVQGNSAKRLALKTKNQVMILHRDLKPENVFLGSDNSVKLGDFGLSKVMQSHDFASTYVGTPFYMSPEICAAERYTLQSDIWSLGCVIYELCARAPPFNAKTHFQLVQKIKEGRMDPLPSIYSPELQNMIKSCLKTNPLNRPDTATLLEMPVVKIMRKEKEIVEIGKILKAREEQVRLKDKELDAMKAGLESEKEIIRVEIEATVRREWEVKARLEIDRQVKIEKDNVEHEIQRRVQIEVEMHLRSMNDSRTTSGTHSPADIQHSSVSTNSEVDFPSMTDMTSLSLESPMPQTSQPPKKSTRTPFTRARTQFDSPMDVQMVDPSPMSIASLSLSPRRLAGIQTNKKNIFVAGADSREKWEPHLLSSMTSEDLEPEDDADEVPDLPSPTRLSRAAASDPFKNPVRPRLPRQQTVPVNRLNSKPALFSIPSAPVVELSKPSSPPSANSTKLPAEAAQPTHPASPSRRISMLPLSADLDSPTRRLAQKPATARLGPPKANGAGDDMYKVVMQKYLPGGAGGRTLLELAQARAGGVPAAANLYKTKIEGEGAVRIAARLAEWEKVRDGEVPVWDPERDEMPSPFLARKGRGAVLGIGR